MDPLINRSAIWCRLLWKDYRQVRNALLGTFGMLVSLQLLYLTLQLVFQGRDMFLFEQGYLLTLLAPTFAAIACSGLLVGHERQSGTWAWSSSLPVGWKAALASKTVVWIASSLVMLGLLLGIYALLWQIVVQAGGVPRGSPESRWQFTIAMILLTSIEVFVLFNIACLLWNDTLLAMMAAAVVVIASQIIAGAAAEQIVAGAGLYTRYEVAYLTVVVSLASVATLIASILLCVAFRWRWTSGQFASVWFPSVQSRAPVTWPGQETAWSTYAQHSKQPGEFRMLLTHGLRSAVGLRVMVLLSVLLISVTTDWNEFSLIFAAIAASLLLGITTFSGDRALARERFFADRGTSWVRLLLGHTLPGFIATTFVLVCIKSGDPTKFQADTGALALIVLPYSAFAIGILTALCLANAVVGTALGVLMTAFCFFCYLGVETYWFAWSGTHGVTLFGIPISLSIVACGIVVQMRRNIVWDRPGGLATLLVTLSAGVLVPLLLCFSLGFLSVPHVPWQGVPPDKVRWTSQTKLPAFNVVLPSVSLNTASPDQGLSLGTEAAESLEAEEWQIALQKLQAELDEPQLFLPATFPLLEKHSMLIEWTALVAAVATDKRDAEVALAAWRYNRDLLDLAAADAELAARSLGARIKAYEQWTHLRTADITFLAEHADPAELLPDHLPSEVWDAALKNRWTIRKMFLDDLQPTANTPVENFTASNLAEILNTGRSVAPMSLKGLRQSSNTHIQRSFTGYDEQAVLPARWFPPLRWYLERRLALQLSNELYTVPNPYEEASWSVAAQVAAHDPVYILLPALGELETHVRQRIAALSEPDPETP